MIPYCPAVVWIVSKRAPWERPRSEGTSIIWVGGGGRREWVVMLVGNKQLLRLLLLPLLAITPSRPTPRRILPFLLPLLLPFLLVVVVALLLLLLPLPPSSPPPFYLIRHIIHITHSPF